MKKFINESKPYKEQGSYRNAYGFDKPSGYLFLWSRLLQSTISQAGTFLLGKKFHSRHCAIYKAEGGCAIDGFGELVLGKRGCYFDCYSSAKSEKQAQQISDLITHIVLNWDPMDPIESMLKCAADYIKVDKDSLRKAIEQSDNGGVFGGDALANFFDWNPFSQAPINEDYERYCLIKFNGQSKEDVDQLQNDRKLGRKLLKKINDKIFKYRAAINKPNSSIYTFALCCSPRRSENGNLLFWINTGRSTNIDGWKTKEQIEEFLNSDGEIVDSN